MYRGLMYRRDTSCSVGDTSGSVARYIESACSAARYVVTASKANKLPKPNKNGCSLLTGRGGMYVGAGQSRRRSRRRNRRSGLRRNRRSGGVVSRARCIGSSPSSGGLIPDGTVLVHQFSKTRGYWPVHKVDNTSNACKARSSTQRQSRLTECPKSPASPPEQRQRPNRAPSRGGAASAECAASTHGPGNGTCVHTLTPAIMFGLPFRVAAGLAAHNEPALNERRIIRDDALAGLVKTGLGPLGHVQRCPTRSLARRRAGPSAVNREAAGG